ncbi:N-ATPase subunit AtpR [Lichenicoccus roseus]|uniref:N-ATPase subunit AtpR n=1 Tax=Lichenicoccus roseus TaxID=2683649 RepID=UPI001485D78F|nr:ATP synthase subunit I [Lichenicoccus roseus]
MILTLYSAAGFVLGLLYFQALIWNADQFASGGATLSAVGLLVGRFGLLACILLLTSLQGALPLLMLTLGLLVGRYVLLRRARLATLPDVS